MNSLDIYEAERVRYPSPYAAMSKDSRGRKYPIPRNRFRTEFQRDRDRIIHSTAFRRLQHKTQVFANLGDESDHCRSRLTHTIEVAQISRTIARKLGLNEDLAEAVALAHDLGHTPFGHAGEEVLDRLLFEDDGFNHNHQSLRVVDYLEKRYPNYNGLNLTYEVREGIIKHETVGDLTIPAEFDRDDQPLLEGQIVNLADEIAYSGHDVDDGLGSGIISLDMIRQTEQISDILADSENGIEEKSEEMIRSALVRNLVDRLVIDLVEEISRLLEKYNIGSPEDVRKSKSRLVAFSEKQIEFNRRLKSFLHKNMYKHPSLNSMMQKSGEILTFLFNHYLQNRGSIPENFRLKFPDQSDRRLATDYIAGMTDRFAFNEFTRLQND